METPPHYRICQALHDKFCRLCVSYAKGHCDKFDVPVDFNFTCDGWERNWEIG